MGKALQLVSGAATIAAGPVFTAAAPVTGDTFAVPVFDPSQRCEIIDAWVKLAGAGSIRFRSPRLHDNSNGIVLFHAAADEAELLGGIEVQRLYPGDVPTIELLSTAASVAELSYLVAFDDLPGINLPLAMSSEVAPRITNVLGLPVTPTAGAAATAYGAGVALNSTAAVMKAGEKYALLGYTCQDGFQSWAITGPDTGSLRIGGPGTTQSHISATWFLDQSNELNMPLVPILQADNQAATQVAIVDGGGATAHSMSLILGEIPS